MGYIGFIVDFTTPTYHCTHTSTHFAHLDKQITTIYDSQAYDSLGEPTTPTRTILIYRENYTLIPTQSNHLIIVIQTERTNKSSH